MIVPQEIYHPLYEDNEKFIILITGGRGSGKSFNASTFIAVSYTHLRAHETDS